MIAILSDKQQLLLHEIGHAGRAGMPVFRPRYINTTGGSIIRMLEKTKLLEKFIGRDGTQWVRLSAAGRAYVDATRQE